MSAKDIWFKYIIFSTYKKKWHIDSHSQRCLACLCMEDDINIDI